jgi:hypothetical protein
MSEPQATKKSTPVTIRMSWSAVIVLCFKFYIVALSFALITAIIVFLALSLLGAYISNIFSTL